MRIARVLHAESPTPTVALERDGAVYDVAALDRAFRTPLSREDLAGASDFHTRVVALGCAGLADLDEALRSGHRPSEARLAPGSFVWLAPCDTDRAAYVQMAGYGARAAAPRYWIGNARALVGHEATLPFPPGEAEPDVELGLAAILGDDVHRATPEQAERAILGYSILGGWVARGEERRTGDDRGGLASGALSARDFAVQLGPVVVTRGELGDPAPLRARLRVRDAALACGTIGAWRFDVAESIAFVSQHVELRAGDVVGAGCLEGGSASAHDAAPRYGAVVELTVERLGKLTGRPVEGPAPVAWRRER